MSGLELPAVAAGGRGHRPAGTAAPAARRRLHPALAAGLAITLGLGLLAALAPWLAPADPAAGALDSRFLPPGPGHPLGTDHLGRDLLSRLLHGARYSLGTAGAMMAASLALGLAVGSAAGYLGGLADEALMRLADAIRPFPGRILALALVGLSGPGLVNLAMAMTAVSWVGMARVVRGITLSLREREYVLAARTFGQPPLTILRRHILPGVLPQVAVLAAVEVSWFIMALAGFSLLGLGAQPPTPEWGMMVSEARPYFRTHLHLLFLPGGAIMLAVLGATLLGEGLRDAMDPRLRRGRN